MKIINYHQDPITMEILEVFSSGFPKSSIVKSLDLYKDNNEVSFGAFRVQLDEYYAARKPSFVNLVTRGTKIDMNVLPGERFRSYIACLVQVPTTQFSLGKPVAPYSSLSVTDGGIFTINKTKNENYNFFILVETSDLDQPLSLAREVRQEKDLTILVISNSPDHAKVLKS